ncbi:MAG: hypothetical protein RXR08_10345 [Sulfolobaceae archaeon]
MKANDKEKVSDLAEDIINAGTFFIAFPKDPLASTSSVIKTELSVKKLAEREAKKDALNRYQGRS